MPFKELRGDAPAESSSQIRDRVRHVRDVQNARGFCNALIPVREIRQVCALDDAGERTLEMAMRRMSLSARVDESPHVSARHLGEAVQYRSRDRIYWS